MPASVIAVHRSSSHSFSKFAEDAIRLVEGLGVEGDAHVGATVMATVRRGGEVRAGNAIKIILPEGERRALVPV